MSASLLYRAFGLRGSRHVSSSHDAGRVTFRIRQSRDQLRCPTCGSDGVWSQGSVERTIRTLPIGSKRVDLCVDVARVYCFSCQHVRQVKLPFAEARKHHTRGLRAL